MSNTVLLSAIATVATVFAITFPMVLAANTYTSLTARWALFLWTMSASAGLWYAAMSSSGCW